MKQCGLCGNLVEDVADACTSCGYDFRTDRVNPNFVPKPSPTGRAKNTESGVRVSSGVKKFAIVGLLIVIFSVLYKYNFNISDAVSDAGRLFNQIKSGKFIKGKVDKNKDKEVKKVELINVRSFIAPSKANRYKDLKIEGISFDASAKSFIIVNGRVISEGETFDKIIVKKINLDSVELIIAGKPQILRVNQRIPFPE